jgi:NTE family protein
MGDRRRAPSPFTLHPSPFTLRLSLFTKIEQAMTTTSNHFTTMTTATNDRRRPKVGVVLGSGGIKALAGIALFDFLREAGIAIDLLVGCSGGGIMACLAGAGFSPADMRKAAQEVWVAELLQQVDYRTVLAIPKLPFGRFDQSSGILKPHAIHRAFQSVFGERRLEDLAVPTLVQTTDLMTGDGVMLDSGLLWQAAYATGALYPILPPFQINGRWLIDGVFSSPLPVLEAVKRDVDLIIAMSFEERATEPPDSFLGYFMRCLGYNARWLLRNQLALSIDLHHHEIVAINVVFDKVIGLRDLKDIPMILELGEKAVANEKEEILSAIKNFSFANP